MAHVERLVAGMHGALSEQSARQAGDMRTGLREWLSDTRPLPGRGRSRSPDRGGLRVPAPPPVAPPAFPAFPEPVVQPSERGRSRSLDRGRTKAIADAAKRAAKSAEIHAAPEPAKPRRGERSRSPIRAGASAEAVVAAVKQRTVPARVTKPKPIAAPRPGKRYGPMVGLPKDEPDKPDDPPPKARKKSTKFGKFAKFVKPRAPSATFDFGGPVRTIGEAVKKEQKRWDDTTIPENTPIVKKGTTFIKKKTSKPAPAAKAPKAAPDPQDLPGAPEPAAKRRKKITSTKPRKSHRPFAIAAM